MAHRIEIYSTIPDTRATIRKQKIKTLNLAQNVTDLWLADVYTIDKKLKQYDLEKISSMLTNPITQTSIINTQNVSGERGTSDSRIKSDRDTGHTPRSTGASNTKAMVLNKFTYAIEIGYLPGVTDNIATTTKEGISDLLKTTFTSEEGVYTSQLTFLTGKLSKSEALKIAGALYNPLIQRLHLKSYAEYIKDGGMDVIVPRVILKEKPKVLQVNLDVTDEELITIGKSGITGPDGIRRGPLALDLSFMQTIRDYFKKQKRQPTDIELESIAQTWSEHCKHTIFANPMDEITDGLFKTYIKKATEEIRKKKGKNDFCISVFTDNSGGIAFDDKYMVTHKVETHNTPSALDPFGGAITGIVGVNRDAIGFGLGAKPVANFYGYCFADPRVDIPLYKDEKKTMKMLSSRRIMDGVIDGVNAGGNQSGIPTPQGFVYFDESYRGKPLVFVGTVGLIPRKIKNKPSHIKKAGPGDYIVMLGGRVGKDGIHGATFSSEALSSGSPATAVQIGDPITQKKLSDAIIKEARDQLLYSSITDNGAGGLSCSVAEMAKESNGCMVELEKVPLKYAGLDPWEIWISESQERMTLAVPKKNWKKFSGLMQRRDVEATIIGEFTNSGKCIVTYDGKTIMDVDLDFLHDGLPPRPMQTTYHPPLFEEPDIPLPITKNTNETRKKISKKSAGAGISPATEHFLKLQEYHTGILINMLKRLNITSFEFISQQYDHIVQGNAVLGPLQGAGRVNGDTSVIRPILSSNKGVIMSQALYPTYSEIDPYNMAACSIDTAIRNAVAAGADPDYLAILDNFCWCSSNDPERLGQLKLAVKACYDYAVAYETPFVSGKDSMFNDFKGFDEKGKPINISVLPTLLISSFGVVNDITKVVSLDAKTPGDLIYILGETFDELGGSEYFAMNNGLGKTVPKVNAAKNKKLYAAYYKAIQKNLIASGISIGRGGLAVALAKTTIGGMLGATISLQNLPGNTSRDDYALYSESQGRILVTVAKENKAQFEKVLNGNVCKQIGEVTKDKTIKIKGLQGDEIINLKQDNAINAYRETFNTY